MLSSEGTCKATWKRKFKLPPREAGPTNHHDNEVDSGQWDADKELSLCSGGDFIQPVSFQANFSPSPLQSSVLPQTTKRRRRPF